MENILFSAHSATLPAAFDDFKWWLGAKVSKQVKSHTSGLPDFKLSKVYPSGSFLEPSLQRPEGSNFAGNPARATALLMMSLTLKCRVILPDFPAETVQYKPCLPKLETSSPQCEHLWGRQTDAARRTAAYILSSIGFSFKHKDGIGRQFSQSLAFLEETALSLPVS